MPCFTGELVGKSRASDVIHRLIVPSLRPRGNTTVSLAAQSKRFGWRLTRSDPDKPTRGLSTRYTVCKLVIGYYKPWQCLCCHGEIGATAGQQD